MNPNAPRINAIITTDKSAYKATEVVFVEILLMDALKKSPYVFPNVTLTKSTVNDTNVTSSNVQPENIPIMIALLDLYGNIVDKDQVIFSNITRESAPTAGFAIKLQDFIKYGDYMIVVSGRDFPPVQRLI